MSALHQRCPYIIFNIRRLHSIISNSEVELLLFSLAAGERWRTVGLSEESCVHHRIWNLILGCIRQLADMVGFPYKLHDYNATNQPEGNLGSFPGNTSGQVCFTVAGLRSLIPLSHQHVKNFGSIFIYFFIFILNFENHLKCFEPRWIGLEPDELVPSWSSSSSRWS